MKKFAIPLLFIFCIFIRMERASAQTYGAKPEYVCEIFEWINEERVSRGLGRVEPEARLMQIAQSHAEYIATAKKMTHAEENGSTLQDRLHEIGITETYATENIAGGWDTDYPKNAWLNSSVHFENMFDPRRKNIGVGVFCNPEYQCAFVMDFVNLDVRQEDYAISCDSEEEMEVTLFSQNEELTDIQGHAYEESIQTLFDEGIINGYPDGTFKPDEEINRAEFTKIIIESTNVETGLKPVSTDQSCFPDVPQDEWYAEYVCYSKEQEVVNGYPDGTFKPEETINFVEAAKIIANMTGESFETDSEIWYKNYVQYLSNKRAIPISITELDKKITRGEMIEMVWRMKNDSNKSSMIFYNEEFGIKQANMLIPGYIKFQDTQKPIPIGESIIHNPYFGTYFYANDICLNGACTDIGSDYGNYTFPNGITVQYIQEKDMTLKEIQSIAEEFPELEWKNIGENVSARMHLTIKKMNYDSYQPNIELEFSNDIPVLSADFWCNCFCNGFQVYYYAEDKVIVFHDGGYDSVPEYYLFDGEEWKSIYDIIQDQIDTDANFSRLNNDLLPPFIIHANENSLSFHETLGCCDVVFPFIPDVVSEFIFNIHDFRISSVVYHRDCNYDGRYGKCNNGNIILQKGYSLDNNIFFHGDIPKTVDLDSFEILSPEYAKDKNNVYKNGEILEGVDPATFDPLTYQSE